MSAKTLAAIAKRQKAREAERAKAKAPQKPATQPKTKTGT